MIKTPYTILLIMILAAAAVAGVLFIERDSIPTIVLKDDGFYPKELVLPSNGVVRFVNRSSHAFWPASDNHPTHDMYSAFDIGHPANPGESWTFTFDTDGVWTFHDHLRPYFRGTIAVGDVDPNTTCLDEAASLDLAARQACWERELANKLEEDGVKEAFALFRELYDSDPEFSESIGCHWMAHKLGETEYGVYLTHQDLDRLEFPPETVYCGYGYYHGFLEHFLRDNPDFEIADAICKRLITDVEEEIPRIRLNCYHAIGHGFVPEPTDIEEWGNPVKMVEPALVACNNIEAMDARTECLQGAFNVIADWMWNNQFGLYTNKDDPLSVCELFSDEYDVSSACYYEVSMRLNPLVNNSIVGAYRLFVSKIPDPATAGTVLNSVAASALGWHIAEDDFSNFILECRQVPEEFQTDCMKGLTGAFVAHGEPEYEYVKALNFCGMDMLTDTEKDTCYWNIIRTFKGAYTKDKVAQICRDVEEPYQKYCSYDVVYE